MRHVLEATLFPKLVAVLGCSLHVLGCAQGTRLAELSGSGGSGGSGSRGGGGPGGSGGAGSQGCGAEVCDGADNDCDGEVDEGCECLPGDSQPCYSGPPGTEGVGTCKAGVRDCDAATETFGPCAGEVLPVAVDTCDGQDDDCNGRPDDGLPDITCGVGACAVTVPACLNGGPGACVPGQPSQELCDGIDNDCDQLVDESFPLDGAACDTGQLGACAAGISQCASGVVICIQAHAASDEVCDGADNDCDGVVDDAAGAGGDCTTGAPGVCGPGKVACQGGVLECVSVAQAAAEVCDGLDNDCDGAVDEGDPGGGGSCDTGQPGTCAQGTIHCSGGALLCVPDGQASAEVCDGLDNDCDGAVDEGNPGAGHVCSCGGTATCSAGVLLCQGCTREVACNDGLDDESDGAVDCADSQCALGCHAAVPPCPSGQTLLVLASDDVPKSITDNATVASAMTLTHAGVVKRAVLQLEIEHTWVTDLDISLRSPDGTVVILSSDNGGSGHDYVSTIFHDGCGTPITAGSAPFNGCYSPEQPLGTFLNLPVNGGWSLMVADDASGDTGMLHAWSLAMCVE